MAGGDGDVAVGDFVVEGRRLVPLQQILVQTASHPTRTTAREQRRSYHDLHTSGSRHGWHHEQGGGGGLVRRHDLGHTAPLGVVRDITGGVYTLCGDAVSGRYAYIVRHPQRHPFDLVGEGWHSLDGHPRHGAGPVAHRGAGGAGTDGVHEGADGVPLYRVLGDTVAEARGRVETSNHLATVEQEEE